MTSLLALVLIPVVLVAFLRNPAAGIRWFLIAVLIAPRLTFGALTFRIEHLLVPTMLLITLLRRGDRIVVPRVAAGYGSFWVWVSAVTAVTYALGMGTPQWFYIVAYARPIMLALCVQNHDSEQRPVETYAFLFVLLSIPLTALSLAQWRGFAPAVNFTVEAYLRPDSQMDEQLITPSGTMLRGVSAFEGPVESAIHALLTIATSVTLFLHWGTRSRWYHRVALTSGIIGGLISGVLTHSGTFVGGLSILVVWFFVRFRARQHLRLLVVSVLVLGCVGVLIAGSSTEVSDVGEGFLYQLERVLSLEVFETRYDLDSGFLLATLKVALERPLTGWGWVQRPEVFLGDSQYLVLGYEGGLIGLGLFVGTLAFIGLSARREGGTSGLLIEGWLLVLVVTGIGTGSFYTLRLQEWWWVLVTAAFVGQQQPPTSTHLQRAKISPLI